MESPGGRPLLRIGELSRRVGVTDHALRAWESRYGLLQPVRSAGGFRLYSAADEGRIRQMQAHLAEGLSAAEAARTVLREDGSASTEPVLAAGPDFAAATVSELAAALRQALDAFDEPSAQAVLDRLVSDLSLTAVLRDVVLPYLAELGERWERGAASIAQEHFATNIVRGRLAGLARGWGGGHGPRAVLACPPGEQHDMALMVFGIVLNRNGWSVNYFGANTRSGNWSGPWTPRILTWSSWRPPSRSLSSRCGPGSPGSPGERRSPWPAPARQPSSRALWGPGS